MSIRKIIAGVSSAALIAGAASALDLTQGNTGAGGIQAAVVVAEEATFAVAGSDTNVYELIVTSTGTFAASENYFVDVTVSGGTFSTDLTGSEVVDGGITISGSSVQIAGQAPTALGLEGQRSVRFLVSNSPAAGSSFGLELPVTFDGCPSDLNFTVSVATSGGVVFEEGTVELLNPAVSCGNAYLASISSDVAGSNFDSVLASPTFQSFLTSVGTSDTDINADGTTDLGANDLAAAATLGVLSVVFDPAGLSPIGGFVTNLATLAALTGLDAEVVSADFAVNFPNDDGIVTVNTLVAAAVPVAAGSAPVSVTVDTSTGDLGADPFVDAVQVAISGTDTIAQQIPTTSDGSLVFGAALGIVGSEEIANGSLDDLNYQGVTCGPFDWVGDANRPTKNIFRITNFGESTTSVIAIISNATIGAASRSAQLTKAFDFTASQLSINQVDLTNDLGEFGIADLTLNFIGGSTSIDCDRLMNSNVNNIVTPFGNDNGARNLNDDTNP